MEAQTQERRGPAGLTPEQQAIRLTGVGASEVAAVVGLSPYASAIDIAARKLRLLPDTDAGEAARWGNRLEAVIADAYAEEEGIDPRALWQPGTLRHPTHSFALCTPDRIRLSKVCLHSQGPGAHGAREFWERNVQVKTASLRVADRWGDEADAIPEEYLVQVQWEMLVTGLDVTDLPVLIGGNRMRIYRLHADEELQGSLVEQVGRFWRDYVQAGKLPPVDERASEYLKARFPRDERPILPATQEARELLCDLAAARRAKERDEAEEKAAANRLKAIIGNAAGIEGVATWKAARDSYVTDWEAVCRDLPSVPAEVIAKHTTTKPGSRRFLPKIPKEG